MIEDPSPKRYHYAAKVLTVHDGDSVTLDLDLGLRIRRREKLRLHGLNAPEMVGSQCADGLKAKLALISLFTGLHPLKADLALISPFDIFRLPTDVTGPPTEPNGDLRNLNIECVAQTFKDVDDKFGRLLARIYVRRPVAGTGTEEWICVNDEMIALGYAKPWDGKGVRP